MNPVLLVLALQLGPAPPAPDVQSDHRSVGQWVDQTTDQEAYPDAWFAQDKLRHGFMSMAIVGFAHAGARTAGIEHSGALVIGLTSSALAGLWKEWDDRRLGRPFSYRDLLWDALGIAAGALIADQVRK